MSGGRKEGRKEKESMARRVAASLDYAIRFNFVARKDRTWLGNDAFIRTIYHFLNQIS